jgi:hypothetical protein
MWSLLSVPIILLYGFIAIFLSVFYIPKGVIMSLEPCGLPDQQNNDKVDAAQSNCAPGSTKRVGGMFDEKCDTAYGREANSCDPMQMGSLVNDMRKPVGERQVIYKSYKAIYAVNEAVTDLFRDIQAIDVNGEAQPVPIVWGTQEKAVAAIVQSNVRQDSSLVVQRIKLPMMALYASDFTPNSDRQIYHGAIDYKRGMDGKPGLTENEGGLERSTIFGVARGVPLDIGYQLTVWTLYLEDMDQILEQILRKFSCGIAYIDVQGVSSNWETIVKLESIANNIETEPGDQAQRVIKFQFTLKAETFIPQPIVRKKAVLKTKVDVVSGMNDEEITQVITRIEEAIKGLND